MHALQNKYLLFLFVVLFNGSKTITLLLFRVTGNSFLKMKQKVKGGDHIIITKKSLLQLCICNENKIYGFLIQLTWDNMRISFMNY